MQPSLILRNGTDPFVAPLRDNEFLIDLVADISGTSPKEVAGQLSAPVFRRVWQYSCAY